MNEKLLSKAASINDLKQITRKKIPTFAFEYLTGGCNNDLAVTTNRTSLDQVKLRANYLKKSGTPNLETNIFGQTYSAPFGVAPVGLNGIIWPRASEIQAACAHKHNIPFILSSVSTTSIEDAARHAMENFWFQLYPPKEKQMRTAILKRAQQVGCKNLVVTIDLPSLSWRPCDIKNGLGIPPKITPKSIIQSALKPAWSLATLKTGLPEFATLKPYIGEQLKIQETAMQIRHALRQVVDESVIKTIRDEWPGNLILKGVLSEQDARLALNAGADGIIVSNHGGRQLDAAVSPLDVLQNIATAFGNQLTIMVDSGVESGIDVGRYLACGASMVFCGRAFMYGVGAFADQGAEHVSHILSAELKQLMEQIHCYSTHQLTEHLI